MRAVLDHQDARVVIDRNGNIVLVNSAAERQLRRVMSELVGKPAASLIGLVDAEVVESSGRLKIVAPR